MPDTEFSYRGKKIVISGYANDDWIFKSIKNTNNFYEIDLLKYIHYSLSNISGSMIDVGANIGNHSVFSQK